MAEAKKVAKAAPTLAKASESGDAAVHQILAEMAIHASGGNEAKVAELSARLADLGYEV